MHGTPFGPTKFNWRTQQRTVNLYYLSVENEVTFLSKKPIDIHGWLEFTIQGLNPFLSCENTITTRFSRFGSIGYKTLMIYKERLTTIVEFKLSSSMPKKFGLVFDAPIVSTTNYVAVLATYPAANLMGYDKILLAFSPMEGATSQGAENYIEFLQSVLHVSDRSIDDVVSLTGDNCAVKNPIANKCTQLSTLQFVGRASHRFNLYLKSMISSNESLISRVQAIMQKHRTQ